MFLCCFQTWARRRNGTLRKPQYWPGIQRLQNEFLFCIGSLYSDRDFLHRDEQWSLDIAPPALQLRGLIWKFWFTCYKPELIILLASPPDITRGGLCFPSPFVCHNSSKRVWSTLRQWFAFVQRLVPIPAHNHKAAQAYCLIVMLQLQQGCWHFFATSLYSV